MRDGTVASAARALGVSRATVLARLRTIGTHAAFADLRAGT